MCMPCNIPGTVNEIDLKNHNNTETRLKKKHCAKNNNITFAVLVLNNVI